MKNMNLSQLDPNQVTSREHDSQNDAKRVVLVGGEKLDISIDSDKIVNAIKEGLSNIKMNKEEIKSNNEIKIIEIEKQVLIPQIQILEVPVIVKEIEYREIEKLIQIIEYKIIEIPVIVKEKEYIENKSNEVPMWVKLLLSGHGLTLLGLLISHFIK